MVSGNVGYPYQFSYQCTKPVENLNVREIRVCDGIKKEKDGNIAVPNKTCLEHLRKNYFYETKFSIPENESC